MSDDRNWNIKRGDGVTVTFTGRKVQHAGKCSVYLTTGGNYVMQYAPYGNTIDLIVKQLPDDVFLRQQVLAEHCTPLELQKTMTVFGQPERVMIP